MDDCSLSNTAVVSSTLSLSERAGDLFCRLSNRLRMNHRVDPGLYALGTPTRQSPVLVTANYRLSFNAVRSAMTSRSAWILVVDTLGINVWCAAGKGTFCTKAIVKQITESKLSDLVSHRQLILPQLGASGVAANKLREESGFSVKFGPVRASDLPRYLDKGAVATPAMRRVTFSFVDRMKLVPMEALPAFKQVVFFLSAAAILSGITRAGIMFKPALTGVEPLAFAGLIAVFAGSVLTPLFLPMIPFRAFSLKGFFSGVIGALVVIFLIPRYRSDYLLAAFFLLAVPAYSSYLAFLFTGSSTYASPSGVKKELKIAWPAYLWSAGVSIVLLALVLLRFKEII